jgi:hypothetical protein
MGCRFVYAVAPDKRIEDVIAAQARKKAWRSGAVESNIFWFSDEQWEKIVPRLPDQSATT